MSPTISSAYNSEGVRHVLEQEDELRQSLEDFLSWGRSKSPGRLLRHLRATGQSTKEERIAHREPRRSAEFPGVFSKILISICVWRNYLTVEKELCQRNRGNRACYSGPERTSAPTSQTGKKRCANTKRNKDKDDIRSLIRNNLSEKTRAPFLKSSRRKNAQPTTPYPAKTSFKSKGKIRDLLYNSHIVNKL